MSASHVHKSYQTWVYGCGATACKENIIMVYKKPLVGCAFYGNARTNEDDKVSGLHGCSSTFDASKTKGQKHHCVACTLKAGKPKFPTSIGFKTVSFYDDLYKPWDKGKPQQAGVFSGSVSANPKWKVFLAQAKKLNPSSRGSTKLKGVPESHKGFNELPLRCMHPNIACRTKSASCKKKYTKQYCKYNGVHAIAYVGFATSKATIKDKGVAAAIPKIQHGFKKMCGMSSLPPLYHYIPASGDFKEFK